MERENNDTTVRGRRAAMIAAAALAGTLSLGRPAAATDYSATLDRNSVAAGTERTYDWGTVGTTPPATPWSPAEVPDEDVNNDGVIDDGTLDDVVTLNFGPGGNNGVINVNLNGTDNPGPYTINTLNFNESGTGDFDPDFQGGTLLVSNLFYTAGGRQVDFETSATVDGGAGLLTIGTTGNVINFDGPVLGSGGVTVNGTQRVDFQAQGTGGGYQNTGTLTIQNTNAVDFDGAENSVVNLPNLVFRTTENNGNTLRSDRTSGGGAGPTINVDGVTTFNTPRVNFAAENPGAGEYASFNLNKIQMNAPEALFTLSVGPRALVSVDNPLSGSLDGIQVIGGGTFDMRVPRGLGTAFVTVNDALFLYTTSTAQAAAGPVFLENLGQVTLNGLPHAGDSFEVPENTVIAGDSEELAALNSTGGSATISPGANIAQETPGGTATPAGVDRTTAQYYLGLATNFTDNNITIGTGTPWSGLTNDRPSLNRTSRTFAGATAGAAATITVNGADADAATTDIPLLGFAGGTLVLGNGTGAGRVAFASATGNPLQVGIVGLGGTSSAGVPGGNVQLNESNEPWGAVNRFVVESGTIQLSPASSQGNAPVPVAVRANGGLDIGNAASINGDVLLEAGAVLILNDNFGLAGVGTITHSSGAITRITNANGIVAATPPANQQSLNTVPGSIVRIETNNIARLDEQVSDAAIFTVAGGDRSQNVATNGANTITLNHSTPATVTDAVLTNDGSGRTFNGQGGKAAGTELPAPGTGIIVGENGATFAATTGDTFSINSNVNAIGHTVTINIPGAGIAAGDSLSDTTAVGERTGTVRITGAATVSFAAGAVDVLAGTLNQSSGGIRYEIGTGGQGPTTVRSGAVYFSDTGTPGNTRLILEQGGTARFQGIGGAPSGTLGSLEGAGDVTIGAGGTGTAPYTIGIGGNNLPRAVHTGFIAQQANSTSSVTKAGTGTQVFDGDADSYRGATTVTRGTLLVNNAHGSAGARVNGYTVNSGGTLGGTHAAGEAIFLAPGQAVSVAGGATPANGDAILAPGASVGTLNVDGGNVVFGDNSTFLVETGPGAVSDLLNVVNGAVLMSTTTDALQLVSPAAGLYTIADYTADRAGIFDTVVLNNNVQPGTSAAATDPAGFELGTGELYTADALQVFYNDTADMIQVRVINPVPEPGSVGLLLLSSTGLLARRRNRRRPAARTDD